VQVSGNSFCYQFLAPVSVTCVAGLRPLELEGTKRVNRPALTMCWYGNHSLEVDQWVARWNGLSRLERELRSIHWRLICAFMRAIQAVIAMQIRRSGDASEAVQTLRGDTLGIHNCSTVFRGYSDEFGDFVVNRVRIMTNQTRGLAWKSPRSWRFLRFRPKIIR